MAQTTELAATEGYAVRARSWLTERSVSYGLGVLLVAAAASLTVVLNNYWLALMSLGLTYSVAAGGFNIVLGWAGQLAFVGATFFGVGAFATGMAISRYTMWAEPALLVGMLVGALSGAVVGLFVMRLRFYYLAIATLAIMFVFEYLYENFPDITGGVSGFAVDSPYFIVLGGGQVNTVGGRYLVTLVITVLALVSLSYLRSTRLTRGWRTLRASEAAAESLGINVRWSKTAALAASGAFLGLAGGWYVVLITRFLPGSFGFSAVLFLFLILVVGGMGTVRGVAISGFLLVVLREYFRSFPGLSDLLFGLMLLLVVIFFRKGIYGTLSSLLPKTREPVA